MTREELLAAMADRKEKMRSIVDAAEKDGRKELTTEERKEFESLEKEHQMLDYQFRSMNREVFEPKGKEKGKESRFAEMVCDCVSGGNKSTIDLRSLTNEAAVHDASVPILYQDLIKPLEKGLILDKVGVKILYNVQGEPMWPEVSGGEASVEGENTKVGDSTLSFETKKATPKRLSMAFPVSRRAINQSNLNLHGLVMEGLGMGVARKLNHIAFDVVAHGAYSGPFVGLSGSQAIEHQTQGVYTQKDIVDIEHAVLNSMVDAMNGKSCYAMNTKMAAILKTTPVEKGQTERILKMHRADDGSLYGEMNGYLVLFCNYIPDDVIMFGDYRYLGIPQFGEMSITIDPYSRSRENIVEFVLNVDMDMVRVRDEAFAFSKFGE